MTVQTNTSTASFAGNGTTTAFPIGFKFNSAADLALMLVDDATGSALPLVLNSHYVVTGAGDDAGGLVTLITAPAAGQTIKVRREVDVLQQTDLRNQGKFFAEVHEDAFDLLTMIAQQHAEGINSAIRVAESDSPPARLPPAVSRANQVMAFDSNGDPIAMIPASGSVSDFAINLANPTDPAKGAVLVGYRGRSLYASLSETIDAKDRGAKGDNATNDYTAIAACVTEAQGRPSGARIKIPAGRYKINSTLDLWPIVGIGWHNLMIEGDGAGVTVLDFSGAAPGSDGIAIHGWGGRIAINGLSVINAPGVGINFNAGEVRGGSSWVSRVSMRDVIVDGCGGDGVKFLQVYMGGFENIESRNNGGYGFNLQGFHTSMMFDRCWAGGDAAGPNGGNAIAGWFVNGLVYSHFSACSADWNGGPGWIFQNTSGVVSSGCGAESNGMEGWLLKSGTADISGIPNVVQNINGLILDGCFAVNNSQAEVNTYANFMGAITANGRPIDVQLRGCVDGDEVGILTSLRLNAASGPIYTHEHSNHFFGSVSSTGSVSRQNNTIVGRSALAKLSANQSIPAAADTALAFDTLIGNRLQATVSGGAVVMPAGVNRVKVTAGVFWDSNSTGDRVLRVVKNGLTFDGCPQQKTAPSGFTGQAVTSAIIEVAQGDTIGAVVYQGSGGALNAIGNGSTFLSVEAVG